MWRILVLPREHLAAQWRAAFTELPSLLADLQSKLDPAIASLVACGQDDGEFLLFDAASQGHLQPVTLEQLAQNQVAFSLWQQRQAAFLHTLTPYLTLSPVFVQPPPPSKSSFFSNPFASKANEPAEQYVPNAALLVKIVLEHPQYLYLLNGEQPVVLPLMTQDYYQSLKQREPQLLQATHQQLAVQAAKTVVTTSPTSPTAVVAPAAALAASAPEAAPALETSSTFKAIGSATADTSSIATTDSDSASASTSTNLSATTSTTNTADTVDAATTAAATAASAEATRSEPSLRPHLLWWLLALGFGVVLLGIGYYLGVVAGQKQAQEIMALEHEIDRGQTILDENKALQQRVAERSQQIEDERRAVALALQQRYQEELAQTEQERQALVEGLRQNLKLQSKVRQRLRTAHEVVEAQAQAAEYERIMQERAVEEAAAAQTAAAKAAAAAKAVAEAKAKEDKAKADKASQAKTTTATTKKLPRCSVIVKEGKVPQLVVVMDGSGSMLNRLSDGQLRIDAAQEAAQALIKRVDASVPIRLFGIQGCPFARDYGVFTKAQRSRLATTIKRINPKYEPIPWSVQTSLISALRGMAAAVTAGNEAVGVLISDGKDTCSNTRHINICQEARSIHKQKPKLKIHVVMLGKEAQQAKCVADITGGQTFYPQNAGDLVKALRAAGRTLEKVCE